MIRFTKVHEVVVLRHKVRSRQHMSNVYVTYVYVYVVYETSTVPVDDEMSIQICAHRSKHKTQQLLTAFENTASPRLSRKRNFHHSTHTQRFRLNIIRSVCEPRGKPVFFPEPSRTPLFSARAREDNTIQSTYRIVVRVRVLLAAPCICQQSSSNFNNSLSGIGFLSHFLWWLVSFVAPNFHQQTILFRSSSHRSTI